MVELFASSECLSLRNLDRKGSRKHNSECSIESITLDVMVWCYVLFLKSWGAVCIDDESKLRTKILINFKTCFHRIKGNFTVDKLSLLNYGAWLALRFVNGVITIASYLENQKILNWPDSILKRADKTFIYGLNLKFYSLFFFSLWEWILHLFPNTNNNIPRNFKLR